MEAEPGAGRGASGWVWCPAVLLGAALAVGVLTHTLRAADAELLRYAALSPLGMAPDDADVLFLPAGVRAASTRCPDARASWHDLVRPEERPLRLPHTLALRAPPPPDPPASACEVVRCTHAGRKRERSYMLRVRNACVRRDAAGVVHVRVLAARRAEEAAELTIWRGAWGSPAPANFSVRLHVEARGRGARWPARALWLRGRWVFVSPRQRFGPHNMFHSSTDMLRTLRRAVQCARVPAAAAHFFAPHSRPLLARSSLAGRLWELGTNGSRTFFLPDQAAWVAEAVPPCFGEAFVPLEREVDAARRACERAQAGAPPPADDARAAARRRVSAPRGGGGGGAGSGGGGGGGAERALNPDVADVARARLGLGPRVRYAASERAWPTPRIAVVHRLSSRRLLNLEFVVRALRGLGARVTVLALECLPLEVQLGAISESSTLVGVHGAALSLAQWLPRDGAVVELRTAPCAELDHSSMAFRKAYALLPAPRESTVPDAACPMWAANANDVDAVADVHAVVAAVRRLDPVILRGRDAEQEGTMPGVVSAQSPSDGHRPSQLNN